MSKRALIIVDMLNDFVDEKGALYCGDTARAIVPAVKKRLARFRQSGDLIVYLKDSHDEEDKEFDRFPKHCVQGSWGNEIISELSPNPGEAVIPKKRFSGFYGTDLENILSSAGVEEVDAQSFDAGIVQVQREAHRPAHGRDGRGHGHPNRGLGPRKCDALGIGDAHDERGRSEKIRIPKWIF